MCSSEASGCADGGQPASIDQLNEAMHKGDITAIRQILDQLLARHPTSGLLWYTLAQLEYRLNNTSELEKIFAGALRNILDLRLWRLYLQHVQRVNITVKASVEQVIVKAYEFALSNIGHDVYSGVIWLEYLEYLKALLVAGESEWDRQQRLDVLRKAYHRALSVPLDGLEMIWQSFDHFENSASKATARKVIAEKAAGYMHCRGLVKELRDIIDGIDREWIDWGEAAGPADIDEARLISWMRWIEWEKANPCKLDKAMVNQRVVYAYRRALACVRRSPDLWLAYASFQEADSVNILKQAIDALPSNPSLVFALVDRTDDQQTCKALFEDLLAKVGALVDDVNVFDDEKKTSLTMAFIQYMAWARRVHGIAMARSIFTRARKHPAILPAAFTASALMEWRIRKDPAVASKIFELGLSRFGASVGFVMSYLDFLLSLNDDQNIRAVFERAVSGLLVSDREAAYPVWCRYLQYEGQFGEEDSWRSVEKRFKELYGEPPMVSTMRRYVFEDLLPLPYRYMESPLNQVDPISLAARIGRMQSVPFLVGEPLMDLLGRLPLPSVYDGPLLDPILVLQAIGRSNLVAAKEGPLKRARSPNNEDRRSKKR